MANPPPTPSIITTGLIVGSVLFPIFSLLVLFGRFLAKRKSKQGFTADDWVIIPTWLTAAGISIMMWVFAGIIGVDYTKEEPRTATEDSLRAVFYMGALSNIPLSLVKISLILFYVRVFQHKIFRITSYVVIGIVVLWGLIFFFVQLLQCDGKPRRCYTLPPSPRIDTTTFAQARVGTSLALDVIVLCLPVPVISQLHMRTSRKVGVVLIFWLGIICVVAASVRIWVIEDSLKKTLASPGQAAVATQWRNNLLLIVEMNISIVAACLPYYGPYLGGGRRPESLVRSVRSILSLSSRGSGGSGGSKRPKIPPGAAKLGSREQSMENGEAGIELQSSGVTLSTVEGDCRPKNMPNAHIRPGGISITRDIHIVSQ